MIRYLIFGMFIFISFLFYLTLSPIFFEPIENGEFSNHDISGIAIIHKGKEYTLNFNQQNQLLKVLNKKRPLTEMENLDFEKIIIYRFNKPNLNLEKAEGNILDQLCLNNF